jgi:hypothetical protein
VHSPNFFAALAGEDQKANDPAVVILPAGLPYGCKLSVSEDVIPRPPSLALFVPITGLMSARPSPIAQVKKDERAARARLATVSPLSFAISSILAAMIERVKPPKL